jgi:hypothetical protein
VTELRAQLPPLPQRMRGLPIDERGYPVPYFVAWIDGKPDHRIVDPVKLHNCVRRSICWICGEPLGRFKSFCIGPMCGINRISSEPPQHLACATFAAQACPFLSRPRAHRREAKLPEARRAPGGIMLEHNPGVVLVWTTTQAKPIRTEAEGPMQRGILFELGAPSSVEFYSEGQPATREQVDAALDIGIPALLEASQTTHDTPTARAQFERQRKRFLALLDRALPQETR